ncbi:retrovirus-related pol polyprotein from transposon TNT 1-94 [Tanacetum coccineum]|uniref:Retrovirus-related pol polyprotein from transposon TNT 1-94 n=1 Tax=Tanacetum coccineum TaxID=301880 RepID=A0ABQ5DFD0_9ASTR
MKASLQGKDNTIRKLKITKLTENVTIFQEQNELFRAENEKIKQHYKELYDSIKITRAKTIEKTTALLTKNENLKAQIKGKMKCVTMDTVKPKVLAHEQQKMQKTNVPVIPSTRVNSFPEASGSKPRSNTKKNMILPAKSDNKKKCVMKYLKFVKTVVSKVKQVWKATEKLFTNVGYRWKSTRKKFTLGEQCPLTRFTQSKLVPLQQHEDVHTSEIVITERLSNTSQKLLTRYKRRNKQNKAISTSIPTTAETQLINASVKYIAVVQIVLWYLDSCSLKHMMRNRSRLKNFLKKFIGTVKFRIDHFGAIMGYEDYVIDLKVSFKKHSCYVRDADGVELLKGSRGSNLHTIFVEDMMKSSPICLLSKASNNKLWLWHRRLNHLNFGTINDLARKYLNGVVERQNRTLVEAARKMLIFSKAPIFLRAEVVANAFFGAFCYPTNDSEDLGKLQATTDTGIFVGYAPNRKGLVPYPVPAAPYVPLTNKNLEILFQPMFDEYFEPPRVERPVPLAPAAPVPVISTGTPSSTTIDQDAPFTSHSPSSSEVQPHISHQVVAVGRTIKDNPFAQADNNPFVNVFSLEPNFEESSSGDCFYNSVLSKVKPKNFKTVVTEACWFEVMQQEIHEFDRLQVWELVPRPDCVMIIALKWIYKSSLMSMVM